MHTTALKKKEVHALLTECMDFLVICKVFVLVKGGVTKIFLPL